MSGLSLVDLCHMVRGWPGIGGNVSSISRGWLMLFMGSVNCRGAVCVRSLDPFHIFSYYGQDFLGIQYREALREKKILLKQSIQSL